MKIHCTYISLSLLLFLTAAPKLAVGQVAAWSNLATESEFRGPGGTGGGNWQEADFVVIARQIANVLAKNPQYVKSIIGIDVDAYSNAVNHTRVQCAFGAIAEIMNNERKLAYYDRSTDGIYLDCPNYVQLQNANNENVVVFHEYMRKLMLEDSEYLYSSRLPEVLAALASTHPVPYKAIRISYGISGALIVDQDTFAAIKKVLDAADSNQLILKSVWSVGDPVGLTDASSRFCYEFFEGNKEQADGVVQKVQAVAKEKPTVKVELLSGCNDETEKMKAD